MTRKAASSNAKAYPKVIKHGNASVMLYRVRNRAKTLFTLSYKQADGKRVLKQFADEKQAKREAEAAARRLHEGNLQVLELKDKDRFVYVEAIKAIHPTGKRLDIAAQEYAQAWKLLDGESILEAAKFYHKRKEGVKAVTVNAAYDQFIAYVQKKGLSDVYLKDLKVRLGNFAKRYGTLEVHTVTGDELRSWLDTLEISNRSRDNALALLKTFFRFCQRNKHVQKGDLPTDEIDRLTDKNTSGEIQIFTPAEMRCLLDNASIETLPYLVLGGFAGIRTAEQIRLEWQDIDFIGGYIEIKPAKAKTRQRRLIPMQPNLTAWLTPLKRSIGPVFTMRRPEKNCCEIVAKRAGIEWKHNALRHSYISYRMASIHDENKVAAEAGNSPAMIYANYRQVVRPEQANEWFSIRPLETENIIPIWNQNPSR
jgi:integrase